MMLNFSHSFLFWFLMELNLMLFCLGVLTCLKFFYNNDSYSGVLYYFIVQCTASFFFVSFSFSQSLTLFDPFSANFMPLLLLFKMGLFPFHFWVFNFCTIMSSMESFLALTMQKVPFLFFAFSVNWSSFSLLVLASSIGGSFLIWKSKNLINILVSSSVYFTVWIFFMLYHSVTLFISFFSFYSFFTYVGCLFKSHTNTELGASGAVSLVVFMGLFLVGLPPLSLFFFKFFALQNLWGSFSAIFSTALWALTFWSMMGYFKLFFKLFFIDFSEAKFTQSIFAGAASSFFFFFFF